MIPKPFPDEILYSRIIRYCKINGLSKTQAYLKLFGKRKVVINPQLPGHIQELENQGFGHSKNIIESQTCYKFFINMFPTLETQLIKSMLFGNASHVIRNSQIANFKINDDCTLNYCKSCITEDLNELGVSYWHLVHQLPFQYICPKHFRLLSKTSSRTFNLPEEMLNEIIIEEPAWCGINDFPIAYFIKSICLISNQNITSFPLIDYINSKLLQLGYLTPSGRTRRKPLVENIKYFYMKSSKANKQLTNFFSSNEDYFNSLFHKSRHQRTFCIFKLLIIFGWILSNPEKLKTTKSPTTVTNNIPKYDKKLNIPYIDLDLLTLIITGDKRDDIIEKLKSTPYKIDAYLAYFPEIVKFRKMIWYNQRKISYRFKILNYLYSKKKSTIKGLKSYLNKEYYWLYLHDKNWLFNHQPTKMTHTLFQSK
jgi:hypothetical protein